MSILNTEEVDFIGVDKVTGFVTLGIYDSLDWEEDKEHLYILQEKINSYLAFIESGEIKTVYKNTEGREIEIKI